MRRQLFRIRSVDRNWGDYGNILIHGMSCHLGRTRQGRIRLERCGPSIPPITLPGITDIVVTQVIRKGIEEAGLKGFRFRPVRKSRIVNLPWHSWDWSAAEPPFYPDDGEPESYIIERPHSPICSWKMGRLWEVFATPILQQFVRGDNVVIRSDSIVDLDLLGSPNGYPYFSVHGKNWLESQAREWIRFEEVQVE